MVTLGKRTRTLEAPANPNHHINDEQTRKISDYEQSREKRIKENLQRMEKLGILDLSLKVKSIILPSKPTPKHLSNRRTPQQSSSMPSSGPPRRSSRLQNVTPVSYSEVHKANKDGFGENEDVLQEEGSKREVYTEEHEKLLGSTEMSWTLSVDGYGKDRRRIYDPVKGKTCHQCRQKTLGHRTHCSKCNMVQGQFCGDCLYMRYGEHVLEAKQNPNWICPVCRGICNCSLCRQAKGWAPTGPLYKKISKLGFKSVAHYLIQTRHSDTSLGKDLGTNNLVSARRSLPFSEMGAPSERNEFPEPSDGHHGLLMPESEDKTDNGLRGKKEKEMHLSDYGHVGGNIAPESRRKLEKRSVLFPDMDTPTERKKFPKSNGGYLGLLKPESEDKTDEFRGEKDKEMHLSDDELGNGNIEHESSPKLENRSLLLLNVDMGAPIERKESPESSNGHQGLLKPECEDKNNEGSKGEEKEVHILDGNIAPGISPKLEKKDAFVTEPNTDSIAGRLKQRHSKSNDHEGKQVANDKEETQDVRLAVNNLSESEAKFNNKLKKQPAPATEPSTDSIAGRLKQRRCKGNDQDDKELMNDKEETLDVKLAVNNSSECEEKLNVKLLVATKPSPALQLKKKSAPITEPSPDNIAGRLRSRCKAT